MSNQEFLDKRGSDHRPVLVRLTTTKEEYRGNFRFDKRLFNQPNVKETICQACNGNQRNGNLLVFDKLKKCISALRRWKQENNLNSLNRINHDRATLEAEHSSAFPSTVLMNSLKNDLCKANQDEETFRSQKSRAKWMFGWDKNSKFFHASVTDNRGKQHIEQLCDVNYNLHKDE